MLLGPASAEAEPPVDAAPLAEAAPGQPAPAQAAQPSAPAGPTLAERLRKTQASLGAWDHTTLREAFRPSEAWLAVLRQPAGTEEAAPAEEVDFHSDVRLTAIVSGRAGSFVRAVIDSKTWVIPVGGEVQGFRLVSIDDGGRSATFRRGEDELVLRLETPRLGGGDQVVAPAPGKPDRP